MAFAGFCLFELLQYWSVAWGTVPQELAPQKGSLAGGSSWLTDHLLYHCGLLHMLQCGYLFLCGPLWVAGELLPWSQEHHLLVPPHWPWCVQDWFSLHFLHYSILDAAVQHFSPPSLNMLLQRQNKHCPLAQLWPAMELAFGASWTWLLFNMGQLLDSSQRGHPCSPLKY